MQAVSQCSSAANHVFALRLDTAELKTVVIIVKLCDRVRVVCGLQPGVKHVGRNQLHLHSKKHSTVSIMYVGWTG